MSMLWLPPSAEQAERDEAEWRARELVAMAAEGAFKRQWDEELRALDPRLRMLRAQETATLPELTPGFWHVMRMNDGAPPTVVLTITNPDGSFREPDSRVFDELRNLDSWHPQVGRDRKERARLMVEAKEKRERAEHEARVDETYGKFRALESPGVSMTSARPWSYRAGARRG